MYYILKQVYLNKETRIFYPASDFICYSGYSNLEDAIEACNSRKKDPCYKNIRIVELEHWSEINKLLPIDNYSCGHLKYL